MVWLKKKFIPSRVFINQLLCSRQCCRCWRHGSELLRWKSLFSWSLHSSRVERRGGGSQQITQISKIHGMSDPGEDMRDGQELARIWCTVGLRRWKGEERPWRSSSSMESLVETPRLLTSCDPGDWYSSQLFWDSLSDLGASFYRRWVPKGQGILVCPDISLALKQCLAHTINIHWMNECLQGQG